MIAGHTGIGLSQRMQTFVLDPAENPFNVLEPGKRPRVTLTPSLALKDGKPWLAFAVQGGDTQDQNLLQFFLNVVEFGMTLQEASEAANFNSYQMQQLVRRARVAARPHRAERRRCRSGCARSWCSGATGSNSRAARRDRSTRSCSTASTARCGAARATTARTTASPGEFCGARLRPDPPRDRLRPVISPATRMQVPGRNDS